VFDSDWLKGVSGVGAGELEAYAEVFGETVRWEGLSLAADVLNLSSAGYVDFSREEIEGRVRVAADVPEVAAIPAVDAVGASGALDLHELSVSGTAAQPTVRVAAGIENLSLQGESFQSVSIEASLDLEGVLVQRLCFRHGPNEGCLSGSAAPSEGITMPPAFPSFPIPVELSTQQPLKLDLARLPFLSLPLRGSVSVGPTSVTGSIFPGWRQTLASLALETSLDVDDFEAGDLAKLAGLTATLRKKATAPGEPGVGTVEADLKLSKLDAAGVTVESAAVSTSLSRLPWVDTDVAGQPAGVGTTRVEASGIAVNGIRVRSIDLSLLGGTEPGDLAVNGQVFLDQTTGARVSVRGDPRTMVLDIDVESVGRFPLAIVPKTVLSEPLTSWLKDATATVSASVKRIDMAKLMSRDLKAALKPASGTVRLVVDSIDHLPEPVSKAQCSLRLSRGRLSTSDAKVSFRNGTTVGISGELDPWKLSGDLSLSLSKTRLSSLKSIASRSLPVDAQVEGTVSLSGALTSPTVDANLSVAELVATGISFGDARMRASGRFGDRIDLSSSAFFPGITLKEGAVVFKDGSPDRLGLVMDIKDLKLARLVPALPSWVDVKTSGRTTVHVGFSQGQDPFSATLDIPESKLSACVSMPALHLCFVNPTQAVATLTPGGLELKGLTFSGGGQSVTASGRLDFSQGWDVSLRPAVDVAQLAMLGETFASYSGQVGVSKESLHLTGALDSPRISGVVRLGALAFQPRQLGSELTVDQAAVRVSGSLTDGDILLLIEEDAPVEGRLDEGTFTAYGWFKFSGWLPDRGLVYLSGREIYYQQPGHFRLVISPTVEVEVYDLQDEQRSGGNISGDVFIAEGEFTRNFDRLLGSFSTAFSRSQERYSRPLTEVFPFLARTDLDLRVHGGNFAISSSFPFGETELAVNMDLQVKGTLDNIKLHDWMHVVPGGSITYKLVKRVFTVNRGTVDFAGDYTKPYIDIEAETEVPYSAADTEMATVGPEEQLWGKRIMIKVRLAGTYPNLTPEFSSDRPEYDVADLQTLLLLGMTRKDLEGRGEKGGGEDISINLLTEDVAGMVSKLLLAPFVDAVSLGFTQEGGILAEAATRIGRAINLSTRVMKGADKSEYSARIQFKITDRLSLEGRMKQFDEEGTAPQNQTSYEARFRYLIPLEE